MTHESYERLSINLNLQNLPKKMRITEKDWQKAFRLLALLKLKVGYKRLDLLRESQKLHSIESTYLEEIGDVVEEEEAEYQIIPEEWDFALEDGDLIEGLHHLSKRQQEVFWKIFVEGKTQEEIASDLKISPASISKTKVRAYGQLREFLKRRNNEIG